MVTRLNPSAMAAVVPVLLVGCIGAAQAEGLYGGGGLGTPNYKSSVNGISGHGSGVGGKLYGGYQITPNFGVEGGFVDLGHIDDANGKVKVRGAYVHGVGSYEFAPQWSVLGSVGIAQARFTTTKGNDSSPALKLGAGMQYDLTKTVALRAQYELYRFSDTFAAKPKIGELTFGLKVGF